MEILKIYAFPFAIIRELLNDTESTKTEKNSLLGQKFAQQAQDGNRTQQLKLFVKLDKKYHLNQNRQDGESL